MAIAAAAVLYFQVEAAHNVAEDVLLSPAAMASPVARARRCICHAGHAARRYRCQLVQRFSPWYLPRARLCKRIGKWVSCYSHHVWLHGLGDLVKVCRMCPYGMGKDQGLPCACMIIKVCEIWMLVLAQ